MADPADDLVRAARVVGFESYSIGVTGEAMFVCQIDQGDGTIGRFAITLPASGLKHFRSTIDDLIKVADRRALSTGIASIHHARDVNVSNSSLMGLRGSILLIFNPEQDEEVIFAIENEKALNIAEAMQKDIYPRMTDAERRRHVAKKSALLSTSRPVLILPGR